MPKPKSEIWEQFQALEKKQGTRYFYVRCKYCDEDGSSRIEGRLRTMKNHLKVCELYLQLQAQKNAACSAPCEDDRVSSISTHSNKSQGSSTSSNLKKLKSSSVLGFMDRAMSPTEISLLHQRNNMNTLFVSLFIHPFFETNRTLDIH